MKRLSLRINGVLILILLFSCRSPHPAETSVGSGIQHSAPGVSVGGDKGLNKDSLKPSGNPRVHVPGSQNQAREDSIRKSKEKK
ncbi:MAG TPA: hypothetical protein VGO45_11905 [Bacteroidia bacterium]|nr:hypothetical protein [Bacteroidia bacterium]